MIATAMRAARESEIASFIEYLPPRKHSSARYDENLRERFTIRNAMRTQREDEFLGWAERSGFQIDPRYPHSAILTFRPDLQLDRFWEVPIEPERRPYFIASLLACMGDWQACYVWRHLGSWPRSVDPERINDVVELLI